jgi:hypothetical protein
MQDFDNARSEIKTKAISTKNMKDPMSEEKEEDHK